MEEPKDSGHVITTGNIADAQPKKKKPRRPTGWPAGQRLVSQNGERRYVVAETGQFVRVGTRPLSKKERNRRRKEKAMEPEAPK